MDKVYQNVDEWLGEQVDGHSLTTRREVVEHGDPLVWVHQAWEEAMRLCKVQQKILQTEIDTLKDNVRYLEEVVKEELR
jgi:hypothetical protein